ncbi:hypothetical protein [Streptomyces olindensis]|uniref:hypothetical protein n=1 Tax=Streptomyces olindensis TaxID=358823 RepID=UPI0033D3718D
MPKKQPTAARKARQRQAATGEKYTTALRAQLPAPVRHREFSARGAGWDPITQRAARRLAEVWPECPAPMWEEKFGDLCWKYCPLDAPAEVRRVLGAAMTEASTTCQTCPSPGRKRVVWTGGSYYGWVQPWVKTCCDACYRIPPGLWDNPRYGLLRRAHEDLVDMYEDAD